MSGENASQYFSSSQRCSLGLRSGFCEGHRSSFTLTVTQHVFLGLVLHRDIVMVKQVWTLGSSEGEMLALQHAKTILCFKCFWGRPIFKISWSILYSPMGGQAGTFHIRSWALVKFTLFLSSCLSGFPLDSLILTNHKPKNACKWFGDTKLPVGVNVGMLVSFSKLASHPPHASKVWWPRLE